MATRKNDVNRKSIGAEMIEGLTDLVAALETGDDLGGRFTCHRVKLDLKPEAYTPGLVKETRATLRASQVIFAKFLGVSAKTVRAWEQGLNTPSGMACRFMDEIRRNPDHYRERLSQSVTRKSGPQPA